MTQPDQYNPPQSANYASLATWASRTEQEWQNTLRTQEVHRWGSNGVLGGLFQGLQQGKPFLVALLQAILKNGFDGEDGDPDGPLENAAEALLAVRNKFTSKWEAIRKAAESGSNVIDNGDFERGVSNQPLVGTFSEEQAYSGSRSLKLTADGTTKTYYLLSNGLTPRTISVSPDEVYLCEFQVFGSGITDNVADGLRLVIEPISRFGADLTDIYVGQTVSTSLNGQWTLVSGKLTLPPKNAAQPLKTVARMKVAVQLRDTVTTGSVWIDQVSVREVTVAEKARVKASSAQAVVRAAAVTGDTNTITADAHVKSTWKAVVRSTTEDDTTPIGSSPKLGDVLASLREHRRQTRQNTRDLQRLEQSRVTSLTKGTEVNYNFSQEPDGDLPAEFTVSTSGPGTAQIGVNDGIACWIGANNASKDARILCQTPTDTDYQVLRGTMATPPQPGSTGGTPKFWALARVSEDGNSYVWARGYADSLINYKCELGYTIDGVEHVWQDNIQLTWSLDMSLKAGIGTNPREYQVWSGGRLVTTYSETGTTSLCGNTWTVSRGNATGGNFTLTFDGQTTSPIAYNASAATVVAALTALGKGEWSASGTLVAGGPWRLNPPADSDETLQLTGTGTGTLTGGSLTLTQTFNRRWGAIAELRPGTLGPRHSGKIGGVSVADDRPRQVYGSTARMYRAGTGNETLAGGGDPEAVPNGFFSGVLYESGDINATTTDGTFTVAEEKPYLIVGRIKLSSAVVGTIHLCLQVWNGSAWTTTQLGPTIQGPGDGDGLYGSWIQYLKQGEKVRLATKRSGVNVNALTGESSGAETYFSITGAG